MDDFEKELKQGFLEEAGQAIDDVEQAFLSLESNPDDRAVLDKIFRLAHNLKGSSRAVGFDAMGKFTHDFESLLLKVKEGQLKASPEIINLLLRCNDHLKQWVDTLRSDLGADYNSDELLQEVQAALNGELAVATVQPEDEAPQESVPELLMEAEGLKIPSGDLFVESEDPPPVTENVPPVTDEAIPQVSTAPIASAVPAPVPQIEPTPVEFAKPELEVVGTHQPPMGASASSSVSPPAAVKSGSSPAPSGASNSSGASSGSNSAAMEESIRVSVAKVEKLLNFVGEMVILHAVLREQSVVSPPLAKTVHQLGKVTKEVQDMAMSLRMVPVKPTFQKMTRIVRDTASALEKKVQLILEGEETELDKTVLEKMNDPLVHLVRNAVDHGIEDTERRADSGKKPLGTVTLRAEHRSGKLAIEIADDGGGIDPVKIRSLAEKKGLVKPGASLSERDTLHLLFAPGFSTKSQITDISGRGVGMDVVKTNVTELGGEIEIASVLGKGSTFTVLLPLTMAIIDGMVVRSGDDRFVIPLVHVNECLKAHQEMIQNFTGVGEVLLLRGENLPLVSLQSLLGRKTPEKREGIALVVRSAGEAFAFLVDDIIGQYQVVVKQLSSELSHLKGFSGSAILGDGRPALIVEPHELIKKKNTTAGRAAPGRIAA